MEELLALERRGWEALSTSGSEARDFYTRMLADEVLMLLPGGMVIDDRSSAVDSMSGAPWERFELGDERVALLGEDVAVVTYRAEATREGAAYRAIVSSTYVRTEEGWRLRLHQQTPI